MNKTPDCQVHIFNLDLDDDSSDAAVTFDELLSQAERNRADKFVFPVHRRRFVRGRTWVRQLLSGFLAVPENRIELRELEFGKPIVKDTVLQFNLSHAENNAILAISETCQVGIDIESYARDLEIDTLRRTLYTEMENSWLDALPAARLKKGFFKLWTAKEARMKVTGEGFSLPPREIEVHCEGEEISHYLNPVQPDISLTRLPDPGRQLCCTLATSAPVTEISYHS